MGINLTLRWWTTIKSPCQACNRACLSCRDIEPGWKLPAEPVVLPDSLSSVTDCYLLVNEKEFQRLRKYVEVPAKLVLDYKYEVV